MGECCGCQAHLHFKTTSRKQPNYSLSPKQLRSLVLPVLIIILPRFLSPLPLAASLIGTRTHEASKLSDRTQCPSVWVTRSQGQHNKLTPLQGCPWEAGGGVGPVFRLRLCPPCPVRGQHGLADWRRNIWGRARERWGRKHDGWRGGGFIWAFWKITLEAAKWNELLHLSLMYTKHLVTLFW